MWRGGEAIMDLMGAKPDDEGARIGAMLVAKGIVALLDVQAFVRAMAGQRGGGSG